jgi:hypothetical protein
MSTCLLVIDDGRGHLDGCLESAAQYLPPLDACVMVDDSDHELGFAGAIQAGWDAVLETGCEWVFHLESDFRFTHPVPVEPMQALIANSNAHGPNPMERLLQVSLLRQPWNDREKAAGGLMLADPGDFHWGTYGGLGFCRHRRYFTTNPSIYRASLCERGWPQVPQSEGVFTHQLLDESDHHHFAVYGGKNDPPRCWHIGDERAGHGY